MEILTSFVDTDHKPLWYDIWVHIFNSSLKQVGIKQWPWPTAQVTLRDGKQNTAGFWSNSSEGLEAIHIQYGLGLCSTKLTSSRWQGLYY